MRWAQTEAGQSWHAPKNPVLFISNGDSCCFGGENNMIAVQIYLQNKGQAWALRDSLLGHS